MLSFHSHFQLKLALVICSVAACVTSAYSQSIDQSRPAPVQSNEVSGTIYARDIGDARSTDHFYAFTGTNGDLLVTVEGNNLNGDVDVFTASTLRPLLKFSLYAGSSSPATKSIFLRNREDLILRVEARTPNDDPGTYRLRFGGSFEPITSGPLLERAENDARPALSDTPVPKGRRVNAAGQRIYEPPEPEVAAAPTPEPTPDEVKPPITEESKPSAADEARATPRTNRRNPGRRQPGRRTRTPQPAASSEESVRTTEPTTTETPAGEGPPTARPPRRGSRTTASVRTTEPTEPAVQEPETGPRLVIETNDGTFVNRYMSGVRRVTVERNMVVVIGKDGKIDRFPLDTIVKMTIAP